MVQAVKSRDEPPCHLCHTPAAACLAALLYPCNKHFAHRWRALCIIATFIAMHPLTVLFAPHGVAPTNAMARQLDMA